jgi:hypothetical protein
MVGAFVGLAGAMVAPRTNLRAGRLVYWSGTLVASVCVFLMAYPPDWRSGITMSIFAGGAMIFIAYANTPFLKLRGRIHAFSNVDRRAEKNFQDAGTRDRAVHTEYGGGVSAAKSWWRACVMVAVLVFGVVVYFARDGSPWLAAVSMSLIVVVALVFGQRDAALENSIASRQWLQFVLTSVVTVGIFTVFYLGAYFLAQLHHSGRGRHSSRGDQLDGGSGAARQP